MMTYSKRLMVLAAGLCLAAGMQNVSAMEQGKTLLKRESLSDLSAQEQQLKVSFDILQKEQALQEGQINLQSLQLQQVEGEKIKIEKIKLDLEQRKIELQEQQLKLRQQEAELTKMLNERGWVAGLKSIYHGAESRVAGLYLGVEDRAKLLYKATEDRLSGLLKDVRANLTAVTKSLVLCGTFIALTGGVLVYADYLTSGALFTSCTGLFNKIVNFLYDVNNPGWVGAFQSEKQEWFNDRVGAIYGAVADNMAFAYNGVSSVLSKIGGYIP